MTAVLALSFAALFLLAVTVWPLLEPGPRHAPIPLWVDRRPRARFQWARPNWHHDEILRKHFTWPAQPARPRRVFILPAVIGQPIEVAA